MIAQYNSTDGTQYLLYDGHGVKEWGTKHFSLKDGGYTDFLPANIGCRLCSKKLRDILEKCKSEKDVLQWLDAEVESEAGEKRKYFILHFPELVELLDIKKSKYIGGVLTKQVIEAKRCVGHEVFSYKECSSLSFVVSEKVRNEIKKENCRGQVYLNAMPSRKSYLAKIQKMFRFLISEESVMQNARVKRGQIEQNADLSHLQKLNLPKDLIEFICDGKALSYNEEKCIIGRAEFVSIDSLVSGRIYVEPKQGSPKKGYYTIPAVDLISECESFDAWGILVWLPDIQMFGTWDCDHRKLRVFQNAVWNDIEREPVRYLNGLWD